MRFALQTAAPLPLDIEQGLSGGKSNTLAHGHIGWERNRFIVRLAIVEGRRRFH